LSTKIHQLVDGRCRLLVILLGPGQSGDSPMFAPLLEQFFDADAYRTRNTVERSFNEHKQWRGIATRYDKHALNYRGGVVLRAITIWLRQ
jgi:transposase